MLLVLMLFRSKSIIDTYYKIKEKMLTGCNNNDVT
jgi:hypothetical protein